MSAPAVRPLLLTLLLTGTVSAQMAQMAQIAQPPQTPPPPSEAALSAVPAVRVVRPGTVVLGTPPELNASVTVRYGSAKPQRVLILMPGFLGGAGSFDRLARQLTTLDPTLAVWAVDRRSALLEPQAELAAADPATLARAVQDGLPVRPAASLSYMQDWGLDTTLRDWRAAVQEARTLTPQVYIGGHSMGGTLSGLYAAYDFGNGAGPPGVAAAGQYGAADVRGLVLLDGVPGDTAQDGAPLTLADYQGGYRTPYGRATGRRGLAQAPYLNAAFFGPKLASRAAAQARLAQLNPDGLAPAGGLVNFPATNLAAGLSQIERRYALLPFLSVTTGRATHATEGPNWLAALTGGSRDTRLLFGPDGTGPVGWQPDPDAPTDPQDFVNRFWTPLSDFSEWYFPQRLTLDLGAARLDTRGTPFERELPVTGNAAVALPVLGIAAEHGLSTEAGYRRYAASNHARLTTHTLPGAAHLDIITQRSDAVARWVLDWLDGR